MHLTKLAENETFYAVSCFLEKHLLFANRLLASIRLSQFIS